MNILSIQSHVAYGHVGNSSAVFPMQRLGHEVWPVNTVQFSNHTGYGAWRGRVFEAGLIDEVVEGIAERGVLARCDAVLSGYMGSVEIGAAILSAAARVRAANPAAIYTCDPVMGDVGRGVFVRPDLPDYFRNVAVPAADIITPNQFELDLLVGGSSAHLKDLKAAVARVHALGPKVVLVTSALTDATPADAVDLLVSDGAGMWHTRTPRLDLSINGAGDAIAALFLVHWLTTRDAAAAMAQAASSVYGLLRRTLEAGSREILTVSAQDEFVAPSRRFVPEPA